ncbi:MAG TPA: hypothetical protein VI454_04020 [Verrucomicrobiae bacterium]
MNFARLRKRCAALSGAALMAADLPSASAAASSGGTTITSRSGQFVVAGRAAGSPVSPMRQAEMAAARRVELDSNLAAVSCERVRSAFNRTLRASDTWKGRISVSLISASRADLKAQVVSTRFRDGWRYRLDLLNPTDDQSFVRAVTQVLLQELGNRSSADRSAEIPLWLSTGVARELLAWEPELLLRDQSRISRELHAPDPVLEPRRLFAQRPALSFDEMSWPTEEVLSGERRQLFDASAHLLVNQLLRLPDGPARLRRFIGELPRDLNWQVTFLRVYEKQFKRLLDVEKWWAVNLAAFTGRNRWQMWPADVALANFENVLLIDVEVRSSPKALPQKSTVTLQSVIQEWSFERQQDALRRVAVRLGQARLNTPPELLRLLDDYRATLQTYLSKRATGVAPVRGQPFPNVNGFAREAAHRLDTLDAERENLRAAIEAARIPAVTNR